MRYTITEYDKALLLQNNLHYKLRITVTNLQHQIIDVLEGISDIGGSQTDSDSNIRRTFSFTLKPDSSIDGIEEKIASWIGFYYEIEIGILDLRTDEYIFYPNGRFCITETSTNYDKLSNSISFTLSDRMSELDGTRNGQVGGTPTISIPKELNGKKQTIRDTTIALITSSTNIDHYIIDDIGEFYGMPQNNPDYMDYRQKNDEWNVLPYDLEYSSGVFMSDILFDIRDLYPSCQMYFDVYDNFCFDRIPSLESDAPELENSYLQKILTGDSTESVTYDISSIKNVTELFGKSYDTDRYATAVSYTDNIFKVTLENYAQYQKYDQIAFKPPASNVSAPFLQINSLPAIPIYNEYTEIPIAQNTLEKDTMCVIEVYKLADKYVAYYLGQYQPHALCVLTGHADDSRYTRDYFSKKYNVQSQNIILREEAFSPFSVQRQGELFDSKSGGDFDNIISDSVARDNAAYYNRLSSTMFDTVTISTVLIPWLDVNVKVNYKKAQENDIYSYIVKSRQDNFMNGTSTITMYRFLQLHEK